jgi:hypothetical protein
LSAKTHRILPTTQSFDYNCDFCGIRVIVTLLRYKLNAQRAAKLA